MQTGGLINASFCLPERPCYSLPSLTRGEASVLSAALRPRYKEEQAAWVRPAVCIHPPGLNRT